MTQAGRTQRFIAAAAALGMGGIGWLGWASGPAGAAPAAPIAQQTFSGATNVVAVEVPVQVIKDGEPVRGLTAKDFEVYDGRRKVNVTGFEMLDLAAPAGLPSAQVPVAARRHFLMLFDLSFSEPKSIVKAREAAATVVDGLHPTDLVAVATYSSLSGPQLVLGFTPDRRQIAKALATLGLPKLIDRSPDPLRLVLAQTQYDFATVPTIPNSGRNAETKDAVEAFKQDNLVDNLRTIAASSEHADRAAQQQMVRNLTGSFSGLAKLMGEVSGRKYVVYLSEGYDSSLISGKAPTTGAPLGDPGEEPAAVDIGNSDRIQAGTNASGADDKFGDTRSQNAVEKMLEEFRRADCVIQAVDIGGLRTSGAALGDQRASGRDALFNMAKSTGGELFENYNDLSAAMGQMLRRTGVTYVLSFQPEDLKTDGSFHKLRVELKNAPRGARVIYRPGFYAPRPYKEQPVLQRLLETANDVMGTESGAIASTVTAASFTGDGKGRAHVPVVVEVDGPSLLAGKQDPTLPVEIYIYALDQNGSVQDFVTQTLGLDLTKAESQLRQTGLRYFANLELGPGKYSIRTLVRNGNTGGSSLRVTDLVVPPQGAPALLPALFQDAAPGRWINQRQAKKAGQPDPPYLFMLKGQPWVPTGRPALGAGQDARVILQGYNLGGDWKAEAKVLDAGGRELPGGTLKLGEKEAGSGAEPARVTATFRPPNLPPGDYTLSVTVTDGAGKAETSLARFAVGGAAHGGR
jgi:VWFA-related protein